mmetsp:Transcript_22224/g.88192  ORF Transcript_22224/g.88192 Transcript_22224/m.88192 type:complete len:295 (+) Transcript_22224:189-1073(+)
MTAVRRRSTRQRAPNVCDGGAAAGHTSSRGPRARRLRYASSRKRTSAEARRVHWSSCTRWTRTRRCSACGDSRCAPAPRSSFWTTNVAGFLRCATTTTTTTSPQNREEDEAASRSSRSSPTCAAAQCGLLLPRKAGKRWAADRPGRSSSSLRCAARGSSSASTRASSPRRRRSISRLWTQIMSCRRRSINFSARRRASGASSPGAVLLRRRCCAPKERRSTSAAAPSSARAPRRRGGRSSNAASRKRLPMARRITAASPTSRRAGPLWTPSAAWRGSNAIAASWGPSCTGDYAR